MTIYFPDISSYQKGLRIQPGTVAVIAKATEGTDYRDAEYAGFKQQAAAAGAVFSAYHFLRAGNAAGQADYCHGMVGSTPVMLDVETEGASKPTVADVAAFIARMRQLGGRVWGVYFPGWYWGQVGGDLASLGVAIVSSNYTKYSDGGPGWAPYGGVMPMVWQYTDALAYGGQAVDFNAFRGTVAELAALINGTGTPTPTPGGSTVGTIPPSIAQKYPELAVDFPPNGSFADETALIWADARAALAADRAQKAIDAVNALAAKVGQPATVDVNALEAAIIAALLPHLTGDVDVNALATALAPAVVAHLGLQVVAK